VPVLGVTWIVASHSVTLQIDGEPRPVLTYAQTVGEMLERLGVPYAEHDDLHPPPDTPLRDGMVVELVHAREITLLIGDESDTVLVTALSVDEVIAQLRTRQDVTRRSVVRTSRLVPVRDGMTVEVANPLPVTVVADGETRDVVTDAATVGGVLSRLDLAVDDDDRVSPDPLTAVEADMRIVVQRVLRRTQTQHSPIAYDTVERHTDRLPQGERREVQAGRYGVEYTLERVVVVDGVQESSRILERSTLREPRDRIVEVGTAPPPQPQQPATESQRQEAPSASQESSPPASESGDRSATGQASYYHHPEAGMTAAHRTLPFGTVVTVTNRANGKSVQVTINDRGPFIDGRIIDLNTTAWDHIAARSTGVIDVRISW
jgi:resuscitation-promoting factor RpfB